MTLWLVLTLLAAALLAGGFWLWWPASRKAFWWVAGGALLLAWLLSLVPPGRPRVWALPGWPGPAPVLLADRASWPWFLGWVAWGAALFLVAVRWRAERPLRGPALVLGITLIGVLVILAGNALALLLAWAILDSLTLVLSLTRLEIDEAREAAVGLLFARMLSWGALLLVALQAASSPLPWGEVTAGAVWLVYAAAWWRLFLLLLEPLPQAGPGVRLWAALVPLQAVAALLPLTRMAWVQAPLDWSWGWAAVVLLGWGVLRAARKGQGLYALQGISVALGALAWLAAWLGETAAAYAWGTLLLAVTVTHYLRGTLKGWWRWLFPLLPLLAYAGLPWTPGSATASMWPMLSWPLRVAVGVGLIGLAWYEVMVARRPLPAAVPENAPAWERTLVVLGGVLPWIGAYWWGMWTTPSDGRGWWWLGAGVIALGGVGGLRWPSSLLAKSDPRTTPTLRWVRWFWQGYVAVAQGVAFLVGLLEGAGGMLWGWVILVWLIIWLGGNR